MTFIIFDKSSCIIFAVVRSTLLLWHFLLHSLFFRSYLVSLQYFDDFYHVRQEFMYHFCCCAQYFVALAFSSAFFVFFVVTLCPCNILMTFIMFDKSSCIIFAVVRSTLLLWHFLLHSLFFLIVTLCPCNILMAFIIFDKSSCIMFAVVRSTLLLLHFLLHSLSFRSYLVSLQYFAGFYHIRQEFMYHVCCCAQYFVVFELSFAFFVPS